MSAREEDIAGGRQLAQLLDTLPVKVERNIMRGALRAGARVMLLEVKQRIPRDSGALAASARVTTRAVRGEVTASVKIGNKKVWYAHLVEFGTKPHYISVSDEDRGRGRTSGTLASIRTVNRRVLQIGANFVGPSVHHPGSSARPYARPAADAGFTPAMAAVQKKIREGLTAAGINTPDPARDEE
jgi:HK97 gp10 family phage protein